MTDFAAPPQMYGTPAQTHDPTAVMGRRLAAWVLDALLFVAFLLALFAAFADYIPSDGATGDLCQRAEITAAQIGKPDLVASCIDVSDLDIPFLEDRVLILSEAESATQTLLSFGYLAFFIVLQGITGASPGKLLTGLRVVDAQGRRAGVGKSIVRTLLWVVDGAPWFVPLVGFIVGLTSTGHRRVGDMAAGTYVVATADVGAPVLPTSGVVPAGQTAWGAPPTSNWPPSTPPTAPPTTAPRPGGDNDAPSDPAADLVPDVSGIPPETPSAPPLIGPDPSWWEGPESDRETPGAPGPEALGLDDPSREPPTQDPPATPTEEFEITTDASPTAGPAPFVAPGTDPATSAPSSRPEPIPAPPPQWDQARNTYIQWEPNRQEWLQWDTVANRWKPIDT